MTYKIQLKNHYKPLKFLIYGSLMFGFTIYVINQNGTYSTQVGRFLTIYYLALTLPTLFLHIEYYLRNRNDVFTLDVLNKTICLNNQDRIRFDEIEKITYFMPPVWHRKGFVRFLPFEDYHYARIVMKNGTSFIFTCLLSHDVEDALKDISGVTLEKKQVLVASMFFRDE